MAMTNAERCRRYYAKRTEHVNTMIQQIQQLTEHVNTLLKSVNTLTEQIQTLTERVNTLTSPPSGSSEVSPRFPPAPSSYPFLPLPNLPLSEAKASGADAPPELDLGPPIDPLKAFWDRAKAALGPKSGSLIGKCRREYGEVAVMEAINRVETECPSDPVSFFIGCLKNRSDFNGKAPLTATGKRFLNGRRSTWLAVERFEARQREAATGLGEADSG